MSAEGKERGEAGRADPRRPRGQEVLGLGSFSKRTGRGKKVCFEFRKCQDWTYILRENKAFRLEANLLEVGRNGTGIAGSLKGDKKHEWEVWESRKKPHPPAGSRSGGLDTADCRGLGGSTIGVTWTHACLPGPLLQPPGQSCAKRKGACVSSASRKPVTPSQDPGLSWDSS